MRMTDSPRSGVLAVALLALAGLLLVACGGEARVLDGTAAGIFGGDCVDSADDEVTIYSGRSENLMQPVLDAFTCETGIDVQVRWGGNSDLALQLDEEGDRTSADVFLSSSPGPIAFLQDRGHLGTIDGDVLGLVADEHQASSGAWVGFSGRKRVAVYNVDNITPADLPASVFDLTDEQYDHLRTAAFEAREPMSGILRGLVELSSSKKKLMRQAIEVAQTENDPPTEETKSKKKKK